MIGAANAGAGSASGKTALPVTPGRPDELRTFRALLEVARGRGIGGARLWGHAGPPRPFAAEAAHAAGALVCFAGAGAGVEVGLWGLVLVALSAGARCLGLPSAAVLLPRRACWSLVLRPAGPRTRRVVVAALDRVRPTPALPWVVLAANGLALVCSVGGGAVQAIGGVALLGVLAFALWRGRPFRPDPAAPEGDAARALLARAERAAAAGDTETAVVLTGCGSANGAGVAAFLDWYALRPADVEIELVPPASGAAAALTHAGWRVTPTPDAPRSPS